MARTQARILVSIWADDDFRRLSRRVQGTYMFLLSQANLNHAGLLPLTVKRWAASASDYTIAEVESDLAELEAADYIVIDTDTEELLIRTLIRNDGVWKQPKVMLAMKADVGEIVSPKLRYRLRDELLKIDTASLEKPETRETVERVIADVVNTLPDTPPDGYRIPLPPIHSRGIAYPHAGAGAPSSASTTTTTSATTPATGLTAVAEDPTSQLLAEHAAAYDPPPPPSALIHVRTQILKLVAERTPPERIRAGLAKMRDKQLAARHLPELVAETTPTRGRTSTTDQRVNDALNLAAQYEEAGQ